MKGFFNKNENKKVSKIQRIINEDEVVKLLKKYKKIKKFKRSSVHTINKLDGKEDIVKKLVDEYMENNPD